MLVMYTEVPEAAALPVVGVTVPHIVVPVSQIVKTELPAPLPVRVKMEPLKLAKTVAGLVLPEMAKLPL